MHGGFGGMLSIRVKGGEEQAKEVAAKLKAFKRATSPGSVESMVERRASVKGSGTLRPVDLRRLSFGVAAAEDSIGDLDQALG